MSLLIKTMSHCPTTLKRYCKTYTLSPSNLRPCELMNMSAAAVHKAATLEGQFFIPISSHKTSNRFGKAHLVVTAELHTRMQLYNRHLPLTPDEAQARAVSDTVSIVF